MPVILTTGRKPLTDYRLPNGLVVNMRLTLTPAEFAGITLIMLGYHLF